MRDTVWSVGVSVFLYLVLGICRSMANMNHFVDFRPVLTDDGNASAGRYTCQHVVVIMRR